MVKSAATDREVKTVFIADFYVCRVTGSVFPALLMVTWELQAGEAKMDREDFTKSEVIANDRISPLFEATVQAVEEAIINAMVAAETMEGINGNKAYALPHKKVIDILKKYNRIK